MYARTRYFSTVLQLRYLRRRSIFFAPGGRLRHGLHGYDEYALGRMLCTATARTTRRLSGMGTVPVVR